MAKFPLECRVVTAEWPQWREFGKDREKLFPVERDWLWKRMWQNIVA